MGKKLAGKCSDTIRARHSGNPRGRHKKYDPAAERKQLKALLGLLETRPGYGFTDKGNPKSLNYILWLIKELEIQIRLQVYDRVTEVSTQKKR